MNRRRPARPAKPQGPDVHTPDGVRLQKVLAQAGVGSRRACEDLIARGKVSVNGSRVTELGTRVDPETAIIHVNGMRVQLDDEHATLALYKPVGVVTAMSDPEGRPTIADFLHNQASGLKHVGRLDFDSEGLLLLTNDGELAHRLTHPSYEVTKTYVVHVEGRMPAAALQKLKEGVVLEDGPAKADKVQIMDTLTDQTLVEITLHEGRNRIVRRMFDAIGHPVHRLVRTQIGPIQLRHLKEGKIRTLSKRDVALLMKEVGL